MRQKCVIKSLDGFKAKTHYQHEKVHYCNINEIKFNQKDNLSFYWTF